MNSKIFNVTSWLIATSAAAISISTAHAHPGHDLGEHGPVHMLTSPYHLAILAVLGLAIWFAGRFIQKQLPKRLVQCSGAAVALAAVVLWGLRF